MTARLVGDSYSTRVSAKDAAWRVRSWSITGDGGPFEARRAGWRPSGLRHRLPVELVGTQGMVGRIERSRGLKGSAARFVVLSSTGRVVGAFESGPQFFGPGDPWLVGASGQRLGRLGGEATYVDAVDELTNVGIRLAGGRAAEVATWSVGGVGELEPDLRLLVVAHVLAIEPWRRGEKAAAARSAKESRYLN